jgi:small subunit ribosomal protein S16
MVTIRLARGGSKARPFYHIVVSDSRMKRDGRHIERLGFYNPSAVESEQTMKLNSARYDYWVSVGAQPSERVLKLVKNMPVEAVSEAAAA